MKDLLTAIKLVDTLKALIYRKFKALSADSATLVRYAQLAVSINDSPLGQVIGSKLYRNLVPTQYSYVVLAHFP